jgi:vacuolar protein sorting-associated protein 13A/C
MFEGILEKVLGRVLGQFIEGFDSKDLNVSVWSGNIVIENVKIKPNVLTEMGFPLDIIVGTLGKLSVKVPWSSI